MAMFLPVVGGASRPDNPATDGLKWELAAPDRPDAPILGPHEGSVTMDRICGPGDVTILSDQWMNPDIYVVPRQGVMNGEQLFVGIPDPPAEGHGDGRYAQSPPVIDHSTRHQALFWSDWYASTAANAGGSGSFRGEHIVIARFAPGSTQGYMPSDPGMEQLNVDRALPSPWDTALTIGGA